MPPRRGLHQRLVRGAGDRRRQGRLRAGIVEYSLGANPLLHDLVDEAFPVRDGEIEIPDRPGLGITVREDFLAAHTVR